MTTKYAQKKEDLPKDIDFVCPICFQDIDPDEVEDGVPNCVICVSGHLTHNTCMKRWKHACSICKTQKMYFCKSMLGYKYVERSRI